MKEDGYLKEWQGGNNIMLVLPQSASELASTPLIAESAWTGAPTGSSLASEARVVARMHAAEAIVHQAEATARAAGMVAQTVMGELINAREEAAVAVRFIKEKGMADEFAKLLGDTEQRREADAANGFAALPAVPPTAASGAAARPRGRPLTDAEIDAQINETLAAQLSGALDLSGGANMDLSTDAAPSTARVDLSSTDAWCVPG